MGSEAQRRPGLLSSNPAGVGIRHTANGALMRAEFHYVLSTCPAKNQAGGGTS